MDDSFMSIGSFDEENFIAEAFQSEPESGSQNIVSSTVEGLSTGGGGGGGSINIQGLLSQPFKEPEPKVELFSGEPETPKNNGRGHRKRKNTTRRCLSTDFSHSSLGLENVDHLLSDSVRKSKEPKNSEQMSAPKSLPLKKANILSSIENTLSPKRNDYNFKCTKFELTPEFNFLNDTKNDENKGIPLPAPRQNQGGKFGTQLQKSFSENDHASIMQAVQLSSTNNALIGDFSKPFLLPFLSNCKHQDLKSISSHILANLINGHYSHCVESFTVVDCRYPYEFEGGHIQNAINLYTQELVLKTFLSNKSVTLKSNESLSKRHILIFHCEFSSERGPSLCRFLRNRDRVQNTQTYPCLNYPEMYLLEGGYKDFFTKYSSLCQPSAYLPMHSKEHEDDLRKYRSVVRSQSFDIKMSVCKRSMNF